MTAGILGENHDHPTLQYRKLRFERFNNSSKVVVLTAGRTESPMQVLSDS